MSKIAPRELQPDEPVTQFGTRSDAGVQLDPPFQNRPRPCDTDGISVILGRLSAAEAMPLVRTIKRLRPGDGVRYSTVGNLRGAGFVVTHTPSGRNSRHASVSLPSDWGDDAGEAFDLCWDEPIYEGGGAG